jgi:restriction endonuclease Mrr
MVKRGRPPSNLNSESKSIHQVTVGRVTKRITESNKDKGDRLETQAYEALTQIGQVTVRTRDGHYDKNKEKYVPTGDGGIDLITITKGGLKIYVQCKNWASPIGVDVVRTFIGALDKFVRRGDDDVGIIIANTFSDCAQREAAVSQVPIFLTTIENINRTVIEVMSKIKINKDLNIKINNAQYILIKKDKVKIKAIGESLNTEIKNV